MPTFEETSLFDRIQTSIKTTKDNFHVNAGALFVPFTVSDQNYYLKARFIGKNDVQVEIIAMHNNFSYYSIVKKLVEFGLSFQQAHDIVDDLGSFLYEKSIFNTAR